MSISEMFDKILCKYVFFCDIDHLYDLDIKLQKKAYQYSKLNYKLLKFVCDNCGAFNHKDQGFCGICKSTKLRKATKIEIEQTIRMLNRHQIHLV
jgi:ribosomal protein S27AE